MDFVGCWDRLENRFEAIETIGKGSFGTCILCRRRTTGEQVVVKQIDVDAMTQEEKEDAMKEVHILSMLDHPNIVAYYESFLDEKGLLHIVMEYADGGDLFQRIQIQEQTASFFPEKLIMEWFYQIVRALDHIHRKNILHRDLKTQNIFLTKDNRVKLGDFGIARILNSTQDLAKTVIGTPYYLSPEIVEDKPYHRKSDVWSLGCVLYEMATLKHAFDGQNLPALIMKIVRGKYPPIPSIYSTELRKLVDAMLQKDPMRRPSTTQILRYEAFLSGKRSYARARSQKKQQDHEERGGGHVDLWMEKHVMEMEKMSEELGDGLRVRDEWVADGGLRRDKVRHEISHRKRAELEIDTEVSKMRSKKVEYLRKKEIEKKEKKRKSQERSERLKRHKKELEKISRRRPSGPVKQPSEHTHQHPHSHLSAAAAFSIDGGDAGEVGRRRSSSVSSLPEDGSVRIVSGVGGAPLRRRISSKEVPPPPKSKRSESGSGSGSSVSQWKEQRQQFLEHVRNARQAKKASADPMPEVEIFVKPGREGRTALQTQSDDEYDDRRGVDVVSPVSAPPRARYPAPFVAEIEIFEPTKRKQQSPADTSVRKDRHEGSGHSDGGDDGNDHIDEDDEDVEVGVFDDDNDDDVGDQTDDDEEDGNEDGIDEIDGERIGRPLDGHISLKTRSFRDVLKPSGKHIHRTQQRRDSQSSEISTDMRDVAREDEAVQGSDIDSFVTQIMTEETREKEIVSELPPPKYMDSVFVSPIESRHPDADTSVGGCGVGSEQHVDMGAQVDGHMDEREDEEEDDDGYDWEKMEDRSFEQDSLTLSDANGSVVNLSSSTLASASTLGSTNGSRAHLTQRIEALRAFCDEKFGESAFLRIYNYLQNIGEDSPVVSTGLGDLLDHPDHIDFIPYVQQLIICERLFYG
uniref:non-specific serine/threonine protein kinase n=1 Tax=Stygiella incarcerata TaxID=1712417 RepID=A0A192ZIP6_9EUKA|nr:Nek1 [Stygiella incarcerata]|eukprot:TRINITY_DN817_c0_g2_i1.p1 TRINITY_DN817_c0_g2~~TRINITY_DN817_c0_g2_i1.p1  ORF type:complete len:914 (-),score=301.03 TRINITY_DN817_c0_g2_i1:46-2787(-)